MKHLALLTPAAMLAALWALQRLEVWMNHSPEHSSRGVTRRVARDASGRSSPPGRKGADRG